MNVSSKFDDEILCVNSRNEGTWFGGERREKMREFSDMSLTQICESCIINP